MTRVDTRPISIRTQIVELKADPSRARQFEGPLALFWEPGAARLEGQPREGLACTFSVCRTPSCPCREVPVRVTGIDDGIYGLRAIEDRAAIVYEPGKARHGPGIWADVTLDLDSGKFIVKAAEDRASRLSQGSAGQQPAVEVVNLVSESFRRNLDSELLEHLRERWRILKGKTDDWKGFDWSCFEPGNLVGWHEAFPEAADGLMEVGDHWVLPFDLYCVDPTCKCDDMKVEFVDMPTAGSPGSHQAQLVGRVDVRFATAKTLKLDPAPGMTKLLRAAWKEEYSNSSSDLGALLSDRQRRMKEVGQELLGRMAKKPTPSTSAEIAREKQGPNEPCSCGSGKKYKRCCMGRA